MKYAYPLLILCLLCVPPWTCAANIPPETFKQIGNWQFYGKAPHYLDLGIGGFDVFEEYGGQASGAARLELRIGNKLWMVGPAIGLLANTDGGQFGYGGIYADIAYKNLVLTPILSAGVFEEGAGKDLGGSFQFRLALGLSWQFANRSRLGVQMAHTSNARLYNRNPGQEDLLITLSWPF